MRTAILLALLSGCTGSDKDGSDSGEPTPSTDTASGDDGGGDSGGQDTDPVDIPDGTNGTVPDEALEAPDFEATNRDGAARDREDLLGHPTVMWFYPAAATPG